MMFEPDQYLNKVLCMDALDYLRLMPDGSVNCIVTSPPYFGLRAYLPDGHPDKSREIGSEPTPREYVDRLVTLFREARRVLRDDGTFWLNLGDTYSNAGKWGGNKGYNTKQSTNAGSIRRTARNAKDIGFEEKNLMMIPARVAIALQDDGWVLRSEIVWHKLNPMPESVTDRCTHAHEMVYMFAKQSAPQFWTHRNQSYMDGYLNQRMKPAPDYRWKDNGTGEETAVEPDNWRDEKLPDGKKRWSRVNLWEAHDYFFDAEAIKEPAKDPDDNRAAREKQYNSDERYISRLNPVSAKTYAMANKRDVWWLSSEPNSEAHFATFPTKLIEPMILAGCPAGGVVLDMFAGSGTTADVARRLGRQFTGCELNPAYIDIIERRLAVPFTVPMFSGASS